MDKFQTLDSDFCRKFVEANKTYFYNYIWNSEDEINIGFMAQDLMNNGYEMLVTHIQRTESYEMTNSDGYTSPAGILYKVYYSKVLNILAKNIEIILNENIKIEERILELENN